MDHFSLEEILAYVAGKTPQEDIFRIEAHLIECEECARRVDTYIYMREHEEIWDDWTAERHAQEFLRARLSEAIARSPIPDNMRKRAAAFAQDMFKRTRAVFGCVRDASDKAVQLLQDELRKIFPSEGTLLFSPVLQAVPIRGQGEESLREYETQGELQYHTQYDPSSKKLTVTVKEDSVDIPWPQVILLLVKEGNIRVGEFEHPEDTDILLVEFDDVPDEYYLFIAGDDGDEL